MKMISIEHNKNKQHDDKDNTWRCDDDDEEEEKEEEEERTTMMVMIS